MNIVSIINSAEAGGAQALICNWKHDIKYENKKILIVLQDRGFFSETYEKIFDKVFHLNVSINPIILLKALFKIFQICRKYQAQIVHTHLLQSDLVGIILSLFHFKVITTIHSSSLLAERQRKSIFLQKLIARFSNLFTEIISTSKSSTEFAVKLGYPASKITEIQNCTPISKLTPVFGNLNTYFLSLARWHPVKDHLTLLTGFKLHVERFPSSKLFLSGFEIGHHNRSLMELIENLHLNDYVRVFDEPQDSRELIKNCIATVLSSKSESLSMVAIESLAESKPVISSRVGDYENVIVNPILAFDAGDYVGLSNAMNYLSSLSRNEYFELQNLALARHKKYFSADGWIVRHLALYSQSLETCF